MKILWKSLVLLPLIFGLTSCDNKSESEAKVVAAATAEDYLDYIPADTPYVITNTKRMDSAIVEKIITTVSAAYGPAATEAIESARVAMAATAGGVPPLVAAILDEFADGFSVTKITDMGMRLDSQSAFYGFGFLPVMRLQLGDPEKFLALVKRIEEKSGKPIPVAEFAGKTYWRIDLDEAFVAIAVIGDQLVAGIATTAIGDQLLAHLISGEKPQNSLRSSGSFRSMQNKYEFPGLGDGYIDIKGIADTMLYGGSGISAQVWQSIKKEFPPVTDVCKAEITAIVANTPRIAFGYTRLDENHYDSKIVFELAPDLAKQLSAVSAAVPGVGTQTGKIAFGFGFDVTAARDFAKGIVAAIAENPYQCEQLKEMNKIADLRAQLEAPMPPFVGNVKGANVVLYDFNMPQGPMAMPTGIKARAVIAVENAVSVYGMASMMQPDVATLGLKPDGAPKPVPDGLIPPFLEAPHIAMLDNAIGVSIGIDMEKDLGDFMVAEVRDTPPLIAYQLDMSILTDLMNKGMQSAAAANPNNADPAAQQISEIQQSLERMWAYLGIAQFSVSLTDNGIEIDQAVTMKW